jgi:hypothetical protein
VHLKYIGKKILDAVKLESTNGMLMLAYMIMQQHNEVLSGPLVEKLVNYHVERDMRKYQDIAEPLNSVSFYRKNLISMLGETLLPADAHKLTLQEKEQHLKQSVNEGQKRLRDLDREQEELEERYHRDVQELEERQIKDSIGPKDIGAAQYEDPALDVRDFNPMEMHRLEAIMDSLEETTRQLDFEFPKLQQEMSIDDWLHVVWALQCEYGVDLRRIFAFALKQEKLDTIDFEELPR